MNKFKFIISEVIYLWTVFSACKFSWQIGEVLKSLPVTERLPTTESISIAFIPTYYSTFLIPPIAVVLRLLRKADAAISNSNFWFRQLALLICGSTCSGISVILTYNYLPWLPPQPEELYNTIFYYCYLTFMISILIKTIHNKKADRNNLRGE